MTGRAPLTQRRRAQHRRHSAALTRRVYPRPDPVLAAEAQEAHRQGRLDHRGLLDRLADLVRGAR